MNSREKRMAIGVASLVGLLVLYFIYSTIVDKFTQRDTKIAELEQTLSKNRQTIADGNVSKRRIAEWNHRSLPSDKEVAPTQYQIWLLELVDHSKLESPTVNDKGTFTSAATKNTPYDKFAFQVKGRTDLKMTQLVQFLYEFYASNQLHTIRSIILTPDNSSKKLEVTMEIEALVLPGADRADKLSDAAVKQLKRGDLAAYQKLIGDRNLFAEYTPAPVTRPTPTRVETPFDMTKYTNVTAIIEEDSGPQLWVLVKPTGDQFRLKEGEDFTVDGVKYTVKKIGARNAVLSTEGGKQVQVSLGENLHDAAPVPTEEL
jgi:hypothetical protein